MLKLKSKTIIFIAGAALLAGASVWGNNVRREIIAGKEVNQMTEKMETYCVGRYLIDLPQDTIVNYGATWIDSVDIAFMEIDYKQPPFSERLKMREAELKEQKNQAGLPSLEQANLFNTPPFHGKIFHYGRNSGYYFMGEEKITLHGINIEAMLKAQANEYRLFAEDFAIKNQPVVARLASNLRPLPPNQIPTEPGFCIERGIILDPPGPAPDQVESIVLHFKLKKYPDVVGNLAIDVNGGDKLDETLLERDAKNDINQRFASRIKQIFKGDRAINSIPGQEVSIKYRETNGTSAHGFMWDAVGKLNDVLAPGITLDISTGYGPPGNPLNSSLPDKAAIELWKRISNSIRLRPTTPGKTSDAGGPNSPGPAPKRLPIKSKATSAINCPQTGIWECAADAPGITDHRRLIEAGQPMPYGVTQRPAKGFGRFLDKTDDDTVEVTWTLAAYEKDAS